MWETRVQSLGQEEPLDNEMTIHSNILAWEIPWTEEPRRLQSRGPQESDRTERLMLFHFCYYLNGECPSWQELFSLFILCLVAQLCLASCDPLDYSLPSSSVHGIFQARILEWVVFLSPGESGSYSSSIFYFLRKLHTLCSGSVNLHSWGVEGDGMYWEIGINI